MSNVRELSQTDRLMLFMRESAGRDVDVDIAEMYSAMLYLRYVPIGCNSKEHRRMQQRVGAVVSRINKKANGMRIVPGERKRTYRLIKS